MPRAKWNEEEKRFLRENTHRMTDEQLARRLRELTGKPFTPQGVRKVRRTMRLAKRPGRNPGMR